MSEFGIYPDIGDWGIIPMAEFMSTNSVQSRFIQEMDNDSESEGNVMSTGYDPQKNILTTYEPPEFDPEPGWYFGLRLFTAIICILIGIISVAALIGMIS